MKVVFKIKSCWVLIGLIFGLGSSVWQLQAKLNLPAPKYLSSPYFVTCKAKCPVIKHATWQELDLDCIYPCIWFYEAKAAAGEALDHFDDWLFESS